MSGAKLAREARMLISRTRTALEPTNAERARNTSALAARLPLGALPLTVVEAARRRPSAAPPQLASWYAALEPYLH